MRLTQLTSRYASKRWFTLEDLEKLCSPGDKPALVMNLSRWKKAGKILALRRGLYTLSDELRTVEVVPPLIAKVLHEQSVLSLDWALWFHGMLEDRPALYTSVTKRVPRTYRNAFGTFRYSNLKAENFFGIRDYLYESASGQRHLLQVVEPEKALLDQWHLGSGEWTANRIRAAGYRNLQRIDPGKLLSYATRFNSPRIERASRQFLKLLPIEIEKTTASFPETLSHQRPVTLNDIASATNLSLATVSDILSGSNRVHVRPTTRDRVKATAIRAGYRPNRHSRILRSGRSDSILIFGVHSLLLPMQESIFHVCVQCEKLGFRPAIFLASSSPHWTAAGEIEQVLDLRPAGVVFTKPYEDCPEIGLLNEQGIPHVTVGQPTGARSHSYHPDDSGALRQLMDHLSSGGCETITFSLPGRMNPSISNSLQRGVHTAIAAANDAGHKLTLNIHTVDLEYRGMETPAAPAVHGLHSTGYVGMKEIIAAGSRPDAVIFTNDNLAHGALLACTEESIDIPRQISIVGMGNSPISSAGAITLTTIQPPTEALAKKAIADLVHAIQTQTPIPPGQTTLPCQLIERMSTRR